MTVYRMAHGTLGELRVGRTIASANALGVSRDELLTPCRRMGPGRREAPGDDARSEDVRQRLAALPTERQLLAIRMMLLVLPEIETSELGAPLLGNVLGAAPGTGFRGRAEATAPPSVLTFPGRRSRHALHPPSLSRRLWTPRVSG
jgi:hypothetical protein